MFTTLKTVALAFALAAPLASSSALPAKPKHSDRFWLNIRPIITDQVVPDEEAGIKGHMWKNGWRRLHWGDCHGWEHHDFQSFSYTVGNEMSAGVGCELLVFERAHCKGQEIWRGEVPTDQTNAYTQWASPSYYLGDGEYGKSMRLKCTPDHE